MALFHRNHSPTSALRVGLIQALGVMGLDQLELEAWVDAYIQAQLEWSESGGEHPMFWAIERFMIPETLEKAEECWVAILEVLRRNPPPEVLGGLSAGALEDLIDCHGPAFIDRIESQAAKDPAFRVLLAAVWESSTPEIWQRVERAAGHHGHVA